MVFVTNKLVKSKPGLICSILSILQPCTAAFRYFFALPTSRTISHLYNRPRKPSIEDIKPQSIAPRASREDRCEKRAQIDAFRPCSHEAIAPSTRNGGVAMACENNLLPQRRRTTRDPVLTTQYVGDHRACTRRICIAYLAD